MGLRVRVAMAALLAAGTVFGLAGPAAARSSVYVGVGVGLGPYYPAYHHHYRDYRYYPPAVVYAPPPVYYAPPPPVVYAPPPVVYAPPPVAANPAGPAYVGRDGRQCREYQSTAMVAGRPQAVYGTACLDPDGSWRIVN